MPYLCAGPLVFALAAWTECRPDPPCPSCLDRSLMKSAQASIFLPKLCSPLNHAHQASPSAVARNKNMVAANQKVPSQLRLLMRHRSLDGLAASLRPSPGLSVSASRACSCEYSLRRRLCMRLDFSFLLEARKTASLRNAHGLNSKNCNLITPLVGLVSLSPATSRLQTMHLHIERKLLYLAVQSTSKARNFL